MKNFISILCLLFILGSCSTVKRNGYYQTKRYKVGKRSVVNFKSKSPKLDKSDKMRLPEIKAHPKSHNPEVTFTENQVQSLYELPLRASESPTLQVGKQSLIKALQETEVDSCDNIILKNGDEIAGIVTEVGVDEIRYKKCSYADGPVYVLEKSAVHMIRYQNGSKDMFLNDQPANNLQSNQGYPNQNKTGNNVAGWLFFIIGILVLIFLSILIGASIMLIGVIILIAP